MSGPFSNVAIPAVNPTNIKRRYSVTSDIVSFRRCARQYGAFNIHGYAPAYQTQIYFGTIIHQVLDRCHSHYRGVIDPNTQGTLPDNGQLLSDDEIRDFFDETQVAKVAQTTMPPAPSDIMRYFVEIENGLTSRGIRAVTSDMRIKAVRLLQYFNRLEGPLLYARVADTEHRLQADQQTHILHGVVDLLVNTGVLAAGPTSAIDLTQCEIWDYKATNRIYLKPADLQTYTFQMRVYAYLYQLKHGVYPQRVILYFLNELDGPTCPDARPANALFSVDLDPDEIQVAMNEFTQTVQSIQTARINEQWNPPPPGQISEQDCAICDLRWDCSTPNNGQGVTLRYP